MKCIIHEITIFVLLLESEKGIFGFCPKKILCIKQSGNNSCNSVVFKQRRFIKVEEKFQEIESIVKNQT